MGAQKVAILRHRLQPGQHLAAGHGKPVHGVSPARVDEPGMPRARIGDAPARGRDPVRLRERMLDDAREAEEAS